MRTRRTTELWLLIAAIPVVLLLFTMLLVNDYTKITPTSFAVPASLIFGYVLAHIVLRFFAPAADPAILPLTFLISGIGICFVLRLAPETAASQIVWLFVGIGLMIATVILVPSIEKLGDYKYTFLLFTIVLLVLPMLPLIGNEQYGSRIWIKLGSLTFQPGEIAKITMVLFLAGFLADNRELLSVMRSMRLGLKFPDFRTLLPLIVMWVIALFIVIFEKDLGSALLFFGVFIVMLYVCTGRLSYVVIALVLVAVGAVGLYSMFSHVQTRVAIWLDPFSDAQGSAYQLVQSLYSLADGGLFGVGIGRGLADIIPVASSDFIFSSIAEEMGIFGGTAIIVAFFLFAVRGFLTAARAKSDMAAFTATGLTTSICLQAFIIIGGVCDLIPLTGITLPFMSQGGSSLLSSFIIVGLLLRAGDEGTGLETEMKTTSFKPAALAAGGVLGRSALGRHLTALISVFAILFAVLIANLTWIQVVRADDIQTMTGNNHTLQKQAERERGAILTSDDVVLAQSVKNDDGTYSREYPQGELASHVVGYYSQQYGTSGVESSMSTTLVGDENFETFADAVRSAAGIQNAGNDVVLTINSKIQQAAQEALQGYKGACVVLDTDSACVLAEASSPSYDANDVASELSSDDESGKLVNRATNTLYAPGSTFKTVTLAAALDTDTVTANTTFKSPSSIEIGGAKITNYKKHSHGEISVKYATAVSSNTVFAQIADKLGAKELVKYSEKFGINSTKLSQDFSLAKSLMPKASNMTEWETAWAGVGQPVGEHDDDVAGPQVTVMQMACVMQAISNHGVELRPYIVSKVLSSSGATLEQTSTETFGRVISKATAKKEKSILKYVVSSGSGSAAQVSGATVWGKTGTAETSNSVSDAWFVGSAKAGGKKVTVALMLEQGKSGGEVAAPRAGEVFYEALDALGGFK